MIYAIPQGEHAISELVAQIKAAPKAKWYRRLKIVHLSLAGYTVAQLAEQFDICRATARNTSKPTMKRESKISDPAVSRVAPRRWDT